MTNPLVTVGSLPHNSLFISDNYIYVIVGECSNCNILVKVISELNNGYWMRTEDRLKIYKFDFFKPVSVITASQLITDNKMTHEQIYEELKELQRPFKSVEGYVFWHGTKKVSLDEAFELLKQDLNSIQVRTITGFPVIRKWLNEE